MGRPFKGYCVLAKEVERMTALKEIYDNIIFPLPSLSYEEFYHEMGNPKKEYENVHNYKNAVFWSFSRKDYQKTNWWAKTAKSSVSNKITIRTANTLRKIVGM